MELILKLLEAMPGATLGFDDTERHGPHRTFTYRETVWMTLNTPTTLARYVMDDLVRKAKR
jgi:hypothetical protein